MDDNRIQGLNDDELIREAKTLRWIAPLFAGPMIGLIIVSVLRIVSKGFSASSITPVVFIPLFISSLIKWDKVKKEMKLRNLL
jgi:hypothetical protein